MAIRFKQYGDKSIPRLNEVNSAVVASTEQATQAQQAALSAATSAAEAATKAKEIKAITADGDTGNGVASIGFLSTLENVYWDTEVIGTNGCFEYMGYECKMIACTYHCG